MNWRIAASVCTIFALVPAAFGQQKADCSQISSPGCGSFNEMLAAQDKDIVDAVKGTDKVARVCFVELEDNFLILSFDLPIDSRWRRGKAELLYHNGPKIATFKRYKDGVSDDSFEIRLMWYRLGKEGEPTAQGSGLFNENVNLSIDSDETNFTARWRNKANTVTTYQYVDPPSHW